MEDKRVRVRQPGFLVGPKGLNVECAGGGCVKRSGSYPDRQALREGLGKEGWSRDPRSARADDSAAWLCPVCVTRPA